jgi:hypothetical protein
MSHIPTSCGICGHQHHRLLLLLLLLLLQAAAIQRGPCYCAAVPLRLQP